MKKENRSLKWGFLAFLFLACSPKVQEIEYGTDGCHFCSMTIVDRQHASQLVTHKNKAFKFDAVECMVNHLKEADNTTIALFLANDYNAPGEYIDATRATYLISKEIPSPMGAFLTAFATKEEAVQTLSEHQGEIFTWDELLDHFNK